MKLSKIIIIIIIATKGVDNYWVIRNLWFNIKVVSNVQNFM